VGRGGCRDGRAAIKVNDDPIAGLLDRVGRRGEVDLRGNIIGLDLHVVIPHP
jgi:hypothetical protein